jgi:cytochrome P450
VEACGGIPDEATAVRISLLVQAFAATEALIEGARRHDDLTAPVDELLIHALQSDPPVPATRRVAACDGRAGSSEVAAGTLIILDLTAAGDADLQFGSGLRPCPGRKQALALAAGVLEAVRG